MATSEEITQGYANVKSSNDITIDWPLQEADFILRDNKTKPLEIEEHDYNYRVLIKALNALAANAGLY